MNGPKILLYYSSHRQLDEIELSSFFFNRLNFIRENSDVMVHCDNDSLSNDELGKFIKFNTKCFISRTKQTFPIYPNGYFNGFLKGLSNNFDFFQNYDIVIHTVPDCYITSEDKIVDLILKNINSEFHFVVDYHPDHFPAGGTKSQYISDFFIFNPKKIKNIFSDHSDDNPLVAESWLYKKLHEHNISHETIYRGPNSPRHEIDDYGLIHNHDINKIKQILNGQI